MNPTCRCDNLHVVLENGAYTISLYPKNSIHLRACQTQNKS